MRISFLILISALLFSANAFGQTTFSARSKWIHQTLKPYLAPLHAAPPLPDDVKKICAVRGVPGAYYLRGLVKVLPEQIDAAKLEQLGVRVGTKAGDIWTVSVPLQVLASFSETKGLKYVELDAPVYPAMDIVKPETKADKVHAGLQLPKAYRGEGVIVGMIDTGMDFTHPNFRNDRGDLRVRQAWLQNATDAAPPDGFDYGSEYVGESELIKRKNDLEGFTWVMSHGCHTTGIAAGFGDGNDETYTGIAPDADIVFVSYGGDNFISSIIDAAGYIYQYAEKVGKPAVINMSLGTHYGPHDGTSLSDQAFDNLTGPGKILVGAAGNEGDQKMHLKHAFNNDTVRTVAEVTTFFGRPAVIEIWGSEDTDFSASLCAFDGQGRIIANLGKYFTLDGPTQDQATFGTNVDVQMTLTPASLTPNHKPNMQLMVTNPGQSQGEQTYVGLILAGSKGMVHVWNLGAGLSGALSDTVAAGVKVLGDFVPSDGLSNMREIGGTGKSVISVGAYCIREQFVNLQGTSTDVPQDPHTGAIASFSSLGPAADGRLKPDISAPGQMVASSISSFDSFADASYSVYSLRDGGKNYVWAMNEGTSMAAPVVTGSVALLLQIKPDLTPADIRDILATTARTDDFTGPIKQPDNYTWGWGKIDIYSAVVQTLGLVSADRPGASTPLLVHPNPSDGIVTFTTQIQGEVRIYSALGSEVARFDLPGHTTTCSLSNYPKGVYFYRVFEAGAPVGYGKLLVK